MADNAARVKQQLDRLTLPSQVLGRKELKELPAIIWDDEEISDIAQGFYNNGNGIIVATQKRLLFVDKGMLYGLKVEDFPLDKITSIQYETGLLLASITIFASGNKAIIKNVEKTKARTFSEGVRARIEKNKNAPPPAVAADAPRSPALDLTSELMKLAALKEKGLLSDEEFTAAKRKLLG